MQSADAEVLLLPLQILLATDPDREGEAISWHITQELQVRDRPGFERERPMIVKEVPVIVRERPSIGTLCR